MSSFYDFMLHMPVGRTTSRQVNHLRARRSRLTQQGLDHEELPPGQKLLTKSLTADRLAQLDALGFAWAPRK